ncbi:Hypothetical protein, putative [Bodo saltans]|uniref:Uncharacterized protein n=1 Tax=Bodo saltans TaxID=75058 RepID=A0A0S4IYF1_BODSA|nr:Hypothetical protein, putative [Bodo saltans]|eukprot:CUG00839.1 Hypothetical protein, putative [Bodo saltans]
MPPALHSMKTSTISAKKVISLHNFKKPESAASKPPDALPSTTKTAIVPPSTNIKKTTHETIRVKPAPKPQATLTIAPIKKRQVAMPTASSSTASSASVKRPQPMSKRPARLVVKKKVIAAPKKANNKKLTESLAALTNMCDAVALMMRARTHMQADENCATTLKKNSSQPTPTKRLSICQWWEAPLAMFHRSSGELLSSNLSDGIAELSPQESLVPASRLRLKDFFVHSAFPGYHVATAFHTASATKEYEARLSLLRHSVPPLTLPDDGTDDVITS